jgi:hypothetical protein
MYKGSLNPIFNLMGCTRVLSKLYEYISFFLIFGMTLCLFKQLNLPEAFTYFQS